MTHSAATMKTVENDRQRVEADAGGEARPTSAHSMTTASFGSSIFER